jgi:hypothetical protein
VSDLRDAINEAFHDAICDGDGRGDAEHLVHHLAKRGLVIGDSAPTHAQWIRLSDLVKHAIEAARNDGLRCAEPQFNVHAKQQYDKAWSSLWDHFWRLVYPNRYPKPTGQTHSCDRHECANCGAQWQHTPATPPHEG